jgi:hypothetical protein
MLEQVKTQEIVVRARAYLASGPAASHVAESETAELFWLCSVLPVYVAVLHKGCESRYVCHKWLLYTSLEQQDLKLNLNAIPTYLLASLLTCLLAYSMKHSLY